MQARTRTMVATWLGLALAMAIWAASMVLPYGGDWGWGGRFALEHVRALDLLGAVNVAMAAGLLLGFVARRAATWILTVAFLLAAVPALLAAVAMPLLSVTWAGAPLVALGFLWRAEDA